ncbi:hypothetical protein U1Q18_021463 [Sarracenia purpurea var. burkii]
MYSSWAYSFAQVTIEIPYTLFQAILYVAITYPSIGYYCFIKLKSPNGYHIGKRIVQHAASFRRLPSTETGKPFIPSLN